MNHLRLFAAAAAALALSASGGLAQTFDSGSDGSDGALTFPAGVIEFDPVALGLDTSDNVFNFTTITVPTGTAVTLTATEFGEGKPMIWLASGDVTINGVLDLNGEDGHTFGSTPLPSVAGAGGFNGGRGGVLGSNGRPGNGPGGGAAFPPQSGTVGSSGGSAGHVLVGSNSNSAGSGGGQAYGNLYLQPIVGGSGGAGGTGPSGNEQASTGGGAGGGALLIASSGRIRVDGEIHADGGWRGQTAPGVVLGGGGSGGAIRLIAARVEGAGSMSALGGADDLGARTSAGRIRIEAFHYTGPTTLDPAPEISTPSSVFPPPSAPSLRLVQIDGVNVATTPTGGFEVPDAVINNPAAVTLNLEASYVPLGTSLNLVVRAEDGSQIQTSTTPLTGTLQNSTATAQVTFPSGFSRVFVTASWTP